MSSDPRLRQLKIKTGVLKRMGKEREYNWKEIAQEEARVEKYRSEVSAGCPRLSWLPEMPPLLLCGRHP